MMTEIVKPKMTMIGQQFGPYKYQSFPISSVEIFWPENVVSFTRQRFFVTSENVVRKNHLDK